MSAVSMAARMRRAGQLPGATPPASPPSLEQLLNLVDRAERGRLSPAEVARLREGIARLALAAPLRPAEPSAPPMPRRTPPGPPVAPSAPVMAHAMPNPPKETA